jgi:hypothetical protein
VKDYEQSSVNLMRTKAEDEEAAQLKRDYDYYNYDYYIIRRFKMNCVCKIK